MLYFFSFPLGASLTPAPNIIDIIKREGEGEEEREHDKGVILFTPAPQVIEREGINNMEYYCVCGLLFDLLNDMFVPLFGAGLPTVIGFFCYTFAPIISAHTTDNNIFISGAVPPAIAADNCFEKERKERLYLVLQYLLYFCLSLHVAIMFCFCFFIYMASAVNNV